LDYYSISTVSIDEFFLSRKRTPILIYLKIDWNNLKYFTVKMEAIIVFLIGASIGLFVLGATTAYYYAKALLQYRRG
jgi:hypothetical protein